MSPKVRLLKSVKIGVRIPVELKNKLIKLNETQEYKYESESKIICRALDRFVMEKPEVKPIQPLKRDERVAARIAEDLNLKLMGLIKTKKYGVESVADIVCLALDKFIDDEFIRLKIRGNK